MNTPLLITIVGPTAVGKTSIAIKLAMELGSIILSADSRQFFKETNIGTAKPSPEQRAQVPHYFVDNLSIHDFYSVGDFEREGKAFLSDHFRSHFIALLVGGSGLYINALVKGFDELPQVPEILRNNLIKELEANGLDTLLKELQNIDPDHFELIDKNNPQRVIRAIEVFRHSGMPISSFWNKSSKNLGYDTLTIGITMERESLYKVINKRVDEMIASGLVEEAKQLHPYKDLYALQTVGYKELFDHFDGAYDLNHAIDLIKRNTRRYAKRQLTWFKRDASVHWFQNNEVEEILRFVQNKLLERQEYPLSDSKADV